jgi:hypothetical protein
MSEWVRFRRTKFKAVAALLNAFSVEELRQIALALLEACAIAEEST